MSFNRLSDLDVAGKRVFIRADLNVPQDDNGAITDDTRIRASVPGIRDALARGAAVMVTSHLGRPDRRRVERRRLAGAGRAAALRAARQRRCRWSATGSTAAPGTRRCKPGSVVLLENCRFNKGEKKDDEALARKMAKLCDVYVNDAFGTAHRAEATTHGIAKFAPVACAGPLMAAELDALGTRAREPEAAAGRDRRRLEGLDQAHDAAALAAKVDVLIVGGGIANTFILAEDGHDRQVARRAGPRRRGEGDPRRVPRQGAGARSTPCARRSSRRRRSPTLKAIEDVEPDDMILDIGPHVGRAT